ncbi:hypothetical protein K438DRAFT_2010589 [Mycena galopus ATCC 62051]|nr:hypothetical protein K438DRAFT_2010589 [Mycena galopus ATCC 62051]
MRSNPFNIARLMVLSLQTHLQVLVLISASWSVNVTQASGQPLPAAELCLIFTSLTFLIMMSLGGVIWCLKITSPFLASLKFECTWSLILLLFQFAATIGATVHVLPPRSAAVVSASHTLLIASAWMAAIITALYLAGLIGAIMLHKPMFPGIWSASAPSVDWFVHRQLDANSVQNDSWTRYLGDIESSAMRKQQFGNTSDCRTNLNTPNSNNPRLNPYNEKAPWAQNIRRGVDEPFTFRTESDISSEARSTLTSKLNAALPPLPLRVEVKAKSAGSRFIERFRESLVPVRSSQQFAEPSTSFPPGVDDHNVPIPLPRRSEWVRADANGSDA